MTALLAYYTRRVVRPITDPTTSVKAVADKYGLTPVHYSDPTPGERPAFEQMLADINAGKVAAVVTPSVEELSRNGAQIERFINAIESNIPNPIVVFQDQPDFDLTTPRGRLIFRMLLTVAELDAQYGSGDEYIEEYGDEDGAE